MCFQTREVSQYRSLTLYGPSLHFPCHRTYHCHRFVSAQRSGEASPVVWVEARSGLSLRVSQVMDSLHSAVHAVRLAGKAPCIIPGRRGCYRTLATHRRARNDACRCTDRSALQLSKEGSHDLRHSSAACRAQSGGLRAFVMDKKIQSTNAHRYGGRGMCSLA